ncbi:hypothetical protein D3C73_1048350 [compost metagenome]
MRSTDLVRASIGVWRLEARGRGEAGARRAGVARAAFSAAWAWAEAAAVSASMRSAWARRAFSTSSADSRLIDVS